jgi:anti-sigma factor RsiW
MNHDEVIRLMGAYLDGELELGACVKIEEHLAGCEACRQRMEEEGEVIEAVRAGVPRYEASAFLATRIGASLREGKRGRIPFWRNIPPIWMWATVALVLALAIQGAGIFERQGSGMGEIARQAVANHIRSLQVNHLMDVASTDQHTVKPWFAGKLDYSPQVIDLTGSGYPLVGGRLDVLDGRNVAAVIYGRRKHYVNLFIWPADGHSLSTHLYTENGYHVLGWTKGDMDYLAVSELGEGELRDFVKLIEDQTVDSRTGE